MTIRQHEFEEAWASAFEPASPPASTPTPTPPPPPRAHRRASRRQPSMTAESQPHLHTNVRTHRVGAPTLASATALAAAALPAASRWATRGVRWLANSALSRGAVSTRLAETGLGTDGSSEMGDAMPLHGSGQGLGSLFNALDWDSVRGEVDRESRARIAIAGAPNAGKSTLVNCLKGSNVSAAAFKPGRFGGARVEDMGLFSVVDIAPATGQPLDNTGGIGGAESGEFEMAGAPSLSADEERTNLTAWQAIQSADLVLWVLDGATGLRSWEHEWICRIRATGKPLLVALNKIDLQRASEQMTELKQMLACPVLGISALGGANVMSELLPRLVDACPTLNTALGRESPAWRHAAALRVTQRATLLSGLVGLEPVPLLDVPFQVLIQIRLVMRIAAIYDEPHSDRYSRELIATMIGGTAIRHAGQQLAKAIPLAGWVVSGAIAACGTWLLGAAAETYFRNGRRLVPHPLPPIRPARWLAQLGNRLRRRRAGSPMGTSEMAEAPSASAGES